MSVAVGDTVTYRGAGCKVLKLHEADAPSGAKVLMVLIERPRAGRRWVLPSEIEAGPPAEEPDRTRFQP